MDAVDRETLLRLAATSEWPCVSIYMPTDRLGIHTDADRIRLRNLVREASEHLVADGMRAVAAEALLASALRLASEDAVWAGGPDGLALFVTATGTEPLWVGVPMPELAVVGDRLYLRPLFAAYRGEKKAWALALDSNKTRLFHLDPASIEEVALPKGTPTSLAEEAKYDLHEESLQYHTVPGATPEGAQGVNAAMFHGHGAEQDFDKVARGQFMLQLSRGVVERIGAESAEPLVLLGVENMIDEFRANSGYAHIAPEQVVGATDYLSASDIRKRVLDVLAPRREAAALADVEEYRALVGTGHASDDAAQIVAAAATGRVKTLLMDDGSGPWGYFDRENFDVTHLCQQEPRYLRDTMSTPNDPDMRECGWDLVDLAASETVRHGGVVRAFRGEDSPITGAAAVYRY